MLRFAHVAIDRTRYRKSGAYGVFFEDMGEDWFALRDDTGPTVFLHVSEEAASTYLDGMSDQDVTGVFDAEVSLDDARFQLLVTDLEECLEAGRGSLRYVVLEGSGIRLFGAPSSLPAPPAGDYEWAVG